jgi:hypothetical protein
MGVSNSKTFAEAMSARCICALVTPKRPLWWNSTNVTDGRAARRLIRLEAHTCGLGALPRAISSTSPSCRPGEGQDKRGVEPLGKAVPGDESSLIAGVYWSNSADAWLLIPSNRLILGALEGSCPVLELLWSRANVSVRIVAAPPAPPCGILAAAPL